MDGDGRVPTSGRTGDAGDSAAAAGNRPATADTTPAEPHAARDPGAARAPADERPAGLDGDPVSYAETRARRWLLAGAALSLVAVGALGTGPGLGGRIAGGAALVVGWWMLVVGLHRFGRVGAQRG